MLKIIYLLENLLISINISDKNKVINNNKFSKINKNLFKSQKSKLKILAKLKNLANFARFQNIDTTNNIKITKYLIFKTKIIFI